MGPYRKNSVSITVINISILLSKSALLLRFKCLSDGRVSVKYSWVDVAGSAIVVLQKYRVAMNENLRYF